MGRATVTTCTVVLCSATTLLPRSKAHLIACAHSLYIYVYIVCVICVMRAKCVSVAIYVQPLYVYSSLVLFILLCVTYVQMCDPLLC